MIANYAKRINYFCKYALNAHETIAALSLALISVAPSALIITFITD